ncbi:hypothetical protein SynBIOSU31_02890 [Synechococcus sp. BIOS-U3-1]|nr:hypothetical protein SynBIOSU31_02890 [Synechococcus sp. BIOS-U3-1]
MFGFHLNLSLSIDYGLKTLAPGRVQFDLKQATGFEAL